MDWFHRFVCIGVLIIHTTKGKSGIPEFLDTSLLPQQNEENLCLFTSDILSTNRNVQPYASDNCQGYIFPGILEFQYGMNINYIQENENRKTYRKILDFDCRLTGLTPAFGYSGKRIPGIYDFFPGTEQPLMIETKIDSSDFKDVLKTASRINSAFFEAFQRTPNKDSRKVVSFGRVHEPVLYVFWDLFCISLRQNYSLNENFIHAVQQLPVRFDVILYIEFLMTWGNSIPSKACVGGEMMIKAKGPVQKTGGGEIKFGETNLVRQIDSRIINDVLKRIHNGVAGGNVFSNIPLQKQWYNTTEPFDLWLKQVKKAPSIIKYENIMPLHEVISTIDREKAENLKIATKLVNIPLLIKKAKYLIQQLKQDVDGNVKDILGIFNDELKYLCPNLDMYEWLEGFTTLPKW